MTARTDSTHERLLGMRSTFTCGTLRYPIRMIGSALAVLGLLVPTTYARKLQAVQRISTNQPIAKAGASLPSLNVHLGDLGSGYSRQGGSPNCQHYLSPKQVGVSVQLPAPSIKQHGWNLAYGACHQRANSAFIVSTIDRFNGSQGAQWFYKASIYVMLGGAGINHKAPLTPKLGDRAQAFVGAGEGPGDYFIVFQHGRYVVSILRTPRNEAQTNALAQLIDFRINQRG